MNIFPGLLQMWRDCHLRHGRDGHGLQALSFLHSATESILIASVQASQEVLALDEASADGG
jgi:hypothetical protein